MCVCVFFGNKGKRFFFSDGERMHTRKRKEKMKWKNAGETTIFNWIRKNWKRNANRKYKCCTPISASSNSSILRIWSLYIFARILQAIFCHVLFYEILDFSFRFVLNSCRFLIASPHAHWLCPLGFFFLLLLLLNLHLRSF